jgi:aspartyl aminopeptidase
MNADQIFSENLTNFLQQCYTPYDFVKIASQMLINQNFEKLSFSPLPKNVQMKDILL